MKQLTKTKSINLSCILTFRAETGHSTSECGIGETFRIKFISRVVNYLKAVEHRCKLNQIQFELRIIENLDFLQLRLLGAIQ
ncbi:hypothetical protein V202x_13440 [Gimesia aquarii]|uniref:Uncharacterized protein n=1 Tax=Gimesia aquarii TaxID=2527964 RepID=A0A517WRV2_9PLAN|nr:hypothetical protein V202x_13440 [Gimesia aquarii]